MAAQFTSNQTVLPLANLICWVRKLDSLRAALYASGHLIASLDYTHWVHSCFSSYASHKVSLLKHVQTFPENQSIQNYLFKQKTDILSQANCMEQEMEEKYTQKGNVITKQKSEICDFKQYISKNMPIQNSNQRMFQFMIKPYTKPGC